MRFQKLGIICLFGKTGSGKTTLLNIIAGVLKQDEGEVVDLNNKSISYVFQDDRLLPWLSARKNITISSKVKNNEIETLLEYFEIKDSSDKKIIELSGGMKRKVDLIKAIAYDGDIFLLDEPFNGIDTQMKEKIFDLIKEKAQDKLIILITHDYNDALKLSDKIIYTN